MSHEAAGSNYIVQAPEQNGTPVVQLRGRVDASMTNVLSEELARLDGLGESELIVDLSSAELLDSAALGTLVYAQKQARRQGGDLILAGVGAKLGRVLELTGLNRTFRQVGGAETR
jgi:anti-sigma B factor antagonist